MVLVLLVALAGCVDDSGGSSSDLSDTKSMGDLALSSEQVPSGFSQAESNQSEDRYTVYYTDSQESTDYDLFNGVMRFNTTEEAVEAINSSLVDTVAYGRIPVEGDGNFIVGGQLASENNPEGVIHILLRNGQTAFLLNVYNRDLDVENAKQLIAASADNMGLEYKEEDLTSLLNTLDPHGPGNPLEVDGLELVIKDTGTMSMVGSGRLNKQADGSFVIVTLDVTNAGQDSTMISSSNFEIVDAQERTYAPDTEAMTYFESMSDGVGPFQTLTFKELGPGLTTEGSVVFDIPEDDKGLVFKACSGGFSSECDSVPLGDMSQIDPFGR